jgi:hypothetical protein
MGNPARSVASAPKNSNFILSELNSSWMRQYFTTITLVGFSVCGDCEENA